MGSTKTPKKCEHPDCDKLGEYRAPKSRQPGDYYWFCLKHVSEYNKSWNYYDGMSVYEIELENRSDEVWRGQMFRFGVSLGSAYREGRFEDPLGIYGQYMNGRTRSSLAKPVRKFTGEEKAALRMFGLAWPFALKDLKSRYKKLARAHHPDVNQGSKESEERFKDIALAYAVLIKIV